MAPAEVSAVSRSKGPMVIAILVVILLVLHQDNWFWTDNTLVFGFLPIALFYHACISIAASVTWFLATKIAWPLDQPVNSPAKESVSSDVRNSDVQHGEAS